MGKQAKNPLIIVYHADCIDGCAAAWVVSMAQDAKTKNNITYVPYEHFNSVPAKDKIRAAISSGAELYFVDITPAKHFLNELMSSPKLKAVHILDHHKSAAKALKDYKAPVTGNNTPALEIHIDPVQSSATKMIWEHLLPAEKPPAIIDLIALMDGSAEGLKTPEDFAAAAFADSKDIRNIDRAFKTLRGLAGLSFNEMAKRGAPIVEDQTARLNDLLENAPFVRLQILPDTEPVNVPIVNANVRHFGRQISGRLVDLGKKSGTGVAFIWFVQKTGAVTLSIRTDGTPDACAIAAHLRHTMGITGGGHQDNAAVHFSSIFEFAKHMPVQTAKPAVKPPAPPSPS